GGAAPKAADVPTFDRTFTAAGDLAAGGEASTASRGGFARGGAAVRARLTSGPRARPRRWTLPRTAQRETPRPNSRAMAAALRPSSHRAVRRRIRSSVQIEAVMGMLIVSEPDRLAPDRPASRFPGPA